MTKWLLLPIYLFIFVFSAFGQQLNFTNFSVSEGLAQSQVFSITETENGQLIVATQGGGLSIFNGKSFTSLTKNQGLVSNNVNILHQYGDSILVGTDKGLNVFFEGEIIKSFKLTENINSIKKKGKAYLIGTNDGVYLLKNNSIYKQKNVQLYGKQVTGFFSDSLNQYWVTTTEGIFNLSSPFKKITAASGLPTSNISCVEESDSIIVLGTSGHGIITLTKGLKLQSQRLINKELYISNLLFDSENKLWIGTQNQGVFRINKKQVDHYSINEGLPNNYVKSFHEDHWGNIWIGSFGGGMSRFTETQFIHYDTYSGLHSNYILDIESDEENKIWTSTSLGGISVISDEIINLTKDRKGKSLGKIPFFKLDDKNNAWAYEEGIGMLKISFRFGQFNLSRIKSDFDLSWINDIAINENIIYIATKDQGILTKNIKNGSTNFFELEELPETINAKEVTHLTIDPKGNLWFVDKEKGLGKLEGKKVIYFDNTSQLDIRSIQFYNETAIIASSSGIYTIKGVHLLRWKNNARLSSENLYQILLDDEQNLWVGSEQGLDKISNFYANPVFQHFGPREGFQGLETTKNSATIDKSGNLWFGTVAGIEKYSKKEVNRKKIPPLLEIKDIRIGYVPLEQTEYYYFVREGLHKVDSLILPYNKKPLEIELSALDLTTAQGANFTYILEGFDEMWAPISKRNTIVFNNLPAGDYILRYKTGNSLAWTPVRSIRIIITPPFYSSWWFIVLAILGFLGLLYLIFRISLEQLRKNNRALKEKLDMERNMVELEQKALRLQMNPHFVFNVLQSIQEQIIKDDKNKARLVIAKFAKLMRSILENSREKYISIDEELQTVEHYMKLEQLIKSIDFDYIIEVDEELDVSEEIIPPLLIQPFIENSIIHGFKHLDRKPEIKIRVELETENNILISIDDNGCGRQKSQSTKSQVNHLHKSLALQVTQERLSILDQKKSDKPLFAIIDKEENGKAVGTRIELRIGI